MKTSLTEIIRTEKYLCGEILAAEKSRFDARLVSDEELRKNTLAHRMVHRLTLLYHRRKLKAEVDSVHERLFQDPLKSHFRESILKLFNY